ncbi:Hypothetical protein R9X50_00703700 [Acrodontium crateriforme]|uniref:Uncharacterized protein n=1 Tax=Acrodontium crateriforme TaxID=150365 RepID=A0AAQ3MCH9_9PEZI|nr:Hypothetical protein R9X50_00703700 [Acrodontium crateriforme]
MAVPSVSPSLPAFLEQSKGEIHAKFVDLEWQQRNRLLAGMQAVSDPNTAPEEFSRLSSAATSSRNRYINVEPFALNRIKLKVGDGHNDYINASPVQLGKRKYIATQGPKDTSVNHFYRMIQAEVKSPAVVVMLTQTHEAGKEKCFPYYPLSKEESPLVIPVDKEIDDGFRGEVELESFQEDATTRSEIRTMVLRTNAAEGVETVEKTIYHILFSGWPDFLVPEGDDKAALVQLVELSARLNKLSTNVENLGTNGEPTLIPDEDIDEQNNPRIVHCSAGVGRSGTFIALDYLLSLLHTGQLDNIPSDQDPIADTVEQLRKQRMMMVQGEGQFMFLYDVLRGLMNERLKQLSEQMAGTSNSLDSSISAPENEDD